MSQENVEIVRAAFEAWNAWQIDALRELYAPDVISRPAEDWPGEPVVGFEAVLSQWKELRETWDADVAEPIGDLIDAGDRVVVRFVWHGTGRGRELTAVHTVRKDRIFEIEYFWDHADALEAAGLSE